MTTARHDYTNCPSKQKTRQHNLDAAKACPVLWRHDHLACDWLELTATDDQTLHMLIEQQALVPGTSKYIGVNYPDPADTKTPLTTREAHSKAIIANNKATFPDDIAHWHYGPFEDACRFRTFPNAGVIVFDTHYSIGDHHALSKAAPVLQFFKHQVRSLGQAVLVLNFVLRGSNGLSEEDALSTWKKALAGYLRIPPDAIPIDIYRSEGRKHRMVLTRISMDAAFLPPLPPV